MDKSLLALAGLVNVYGVFTGYKKYDRRFAAFINCFLPYAAGVFARSDNGLVIKRACSNILAGVFPAVIYN
jgi:hypothetical protein